MSLKSNKNKPKFRINKYQKINKLSIVYITDEMYLFPTIVSITSLALTKKKKVKYCITIIKYGKVNELLLQQLHIFLKRYQIELKLKESSNYLNDLESLVQKNRHVSKAALIKFYLPEIFKYNDKLLYLDSDTIIQKDISFLFETPIEDAYGAVVKDTYSHANKKNRKKMELCENFNKFYFNTGVMLLNLKKMREDDITNKLIKHKIKFDTLFMDQDNFNAIIGNNVKFISYKFNLLNYFVQIHTKSFLSKFYEENLPKRNFLLYINAYILHFGGKPKVWETYALYISDIYNYYYNKSILKNITTLEIKDKDRILSNKLNKIRSYLYILVSFLRTL